MKVRSIETLACDAGWRNYHFVKLTTDTGIVGWSEFDEGSCTGVSTVIERLARGSSANPSERTSASTPSSIAQPGRPPAVSSRSPWPRSRMHCSTPRRRTSACRSMSSSRQDPDRIRVYWSHCATWRINHPSHYKPAITDLDGVRALGREVREKGFTALKTNLFIYDAEKKNPRGWRPGFGVPSPPSSMSTATCCAIS